MYMYMDTLIYTCMYTYICIYTYIYVFVCTRNLDKYVMICLFRKRRWRRRVCSFWAPPGVPKLFKLLKLGCLNSLGLRLRPPNYANYSNYSHCRV